MNPPDPPRMDRRVAIKWILAAGAGAVLMKGRVLRAAGTTPPAGQAAAGYGTDPDIMKAYKPGDLWPLTFSDGDRRAATALCDIIIPADAQSPSASSVGVVDFLDEWVSAPYPDNVVDRKTVMEGLAWLDAASQRRSGARFADAASADREALCADMARGKAAGPGMEAAARFFKTFRNLVGRGYYTTPAGMKDLGYVGNVPLARFEGPPADLVARLGLTDEVKW